jgi:phage protein D/phage baseplate assembly protein gpV
MVEGSPTPLFEGQVTAVEYVYQPDHGRELHVRAYDLLHRLRKRQTVRAHTQVTARDLAQEFVADLGLTVEADESGPMWPNLYQYDQSDLALLVEITEKCGLYLTVREGALCLITLEGNGTAQSLTLGETLLEARIELNADQASSEVSAIGWDALRVQSYDGQAASPRSGRNVNAFVTADEVGGDGQWQFVDEGTADDDHAVGLAQAELDRRSAGEVTLWGVAEGNPDLRPGTPVDVENVESALNGRYIITEATHTIDERLGFVSEISTRPPPPRRRNRYAVSTLGIVSQVSDPDDLGRVKVTLPTYNEIESDWLEVLTAAAGPDKGLIALPDIGDSVLVLLTHGDPSQGVVMGGLFGMDGPPDSGVEEGEVRRYTFLTRGGQRIQLDDSGILIRLENADGSYIEMAPDKVHLHAATDLEIEAPGQSVVIRGKSIDFQTG